MDKELSFLYLNEEDMIEAGVKDMPRCIETIEDALILLVNGDYRMGGISGNDHGCKVTFPKESSIKDMPTDEPDYRFTTMPAYLGGRFHVFGIKSYGSHHTNKKNGLPRSILMMSLLDINTGAPIAYMSANILSAMRSAATVGVGIKHLCKDNPDCVSIIGPGVLSSYTLDAMITTKPTINQLKIKGRTAESTISFVQKAKVKYPQLQDIIVCDSISEACIDSDIVFFGTTNASTFNDNPVIEKRWIKKGALVISASSLLVSTDFLSDPDVLCVADNYEMYQGWGTGSPKPTQKYVSTLLGMAYYDAVCENAISKKDIIDIGKVIMGENQERVDNDHIVLYAVGGMPIEDVAWGFDCYQRAKELGIGTRLKLWDESKLME